VSGVWFLENVILDYGISASRKEIELHRVLWGKNGCGVWSHLQVQEGGEDVKGEGE